MRVKTDFIWFAKITRRTFFMKLIMATALIAVIPNLLSDVVAYFKVSQTFERETGNVKLQYLHQTINAVEIVLNRIRENSRQLALSQSIKDFESFPNGGYYESIQGEIPKEDLDTLYGYLETKTNICLTINSFMLSNEFVDSVYYYDSAKYLVLTSELDGTNRQFATEAFYDYGWREAMEVKNQNPVLMNTRVTKSYSGNEKSLLSVVYKSQKNGNAIVVNLDATQIFSKIINKVNDPDEIYVVSPTGKVLFTGSEEIMHQPISRIMPGNDGLIGNTGSFVSEIDGRKMLISHSASSMLGWTFINTSEMKAITSGMASIRQTIVLSAVLLVLLSVALAYLSSRSLYRPISRLKALAGIKTPENRSEPTDELGSIGNFMQSTIHERDFYKEKLAESLPFHREQFKLSLLSRQSQCTEEFESMKSYLGVALDPYDLAVLVLSMDESLTLGTPPDRIMNDLFKIRILDVIARCPALEMNHIAVDAGRDTIAIVLNCGGIDQQQLFRLAQELLDDVNGETDGSCTIGIGRRCPSIADLPQAYEEALEALKYRILHGSGYVISIDDIRLDQASEFHYPKQQEEQLLGHMKTARTGEALEAFNAFVAEIEAHKNKLHYNQIQPLFVQLLTAIMNMYNQLGADMTAVTGGSNPYRELLDQDSMSKIGKWFHRIITLTTVYIEGEMNAKVNQHISKTIEIIERDYGMDLSLNAVAEQLNLNPAYISRLFKQMTGQPFVDYLKHIRIERSKALLLAEGGMKINEIGRQVGYNSSYYFIKVFKELMGLTPGEFKKLYGS